MLQCYHATSTMRGDSVNGLREIPFDAVVFWAKHHELPHRLTNWLWDVIHLADRDVLEHMRKKT